MPIHDWSRVEPGIFHHFHHSWIEEIQRALNENVLPDEYYAMAEQHAAGFGPDVLTLQAAEGLEDGEAPRNLTENRAGLLVAPPAVELTAEADIEFYRRKQSAVVVRHSSGDEIVAVVEVVSRGNKSSRHAIRSFVDKATELLDRRIHLLIIDLQRPGTQDPDGIHGVIWQEISGQDYDAPVGSPLTLVAYESTLTVRAYVTPMAMGDVLRDMPLFLQPGGHVLIPLESTYRRAFDAFPRRWRRVLEQDR